MLEGATPIGCGESAQLWQLADGTVLKVFRRHVPAPVVRREFDALRAVRGLGIASPEPIELVGLGEGEAIHSSFVPGRTVLLRVRRNPIGMIWALARLAWTQARLHQTVVTAGSLPDGRAAMKRRIVASHAGAKAIAAALRQLQALPPGDRLCHGDLHLDNVMDDRGRWTIIDWARACAGTPASDAARTELLIRFGAAGYPETLWLIRALRWLSAVFFRCCYCLCARCSPASVVAWHLPVAVAWMQGQATYRRDALMRFVAAQTG